ncbi:Ulp1-like peptidase [Cucumis melo var. makuwa]|uniref:Ulp1-like peptidase n=1 Tax=Cucumis melo var. makuwa TaxID=1194695 RepID=A0A5A7UK53_CUCMM|nr:Ulp1-like peptidase [Cucumis melo var. makuwa]
MQFDMDVLGRVDDEEIFKNFDWSTFFYTRLLNSMKTILHGKKSIQIKEGKKFESSDILQRQRLRTCFQVWAYETLSTASEHLATKNSKRSIPRILRSNCTQAPSYKMLQKNIFDNKNTVVQPKLKLSTPEKAFMESRIREDDNMEIEDDESMSDINSSDTNTPADTMNNQPSDHNDMNNLRSTSSPLLQYNENVGGFNSTVQPSPRRKERKTVVDQSEMHPITNKKRSRSNDKLE